MSRVLLVDDEVYNTRFLARALEADGHDVRIARGPSDVRKLLAGMNDFDILVTDLMMPDQGAYGIRNRHDKYFTGFYIAEEIRLKFPTIPIIIYTRASVDFIRRDLSEKTKGTQNLFVISACASSDIVESVKLFLSKGIEPGKREGALKRFFDSLVLQPNMMGLGIDLRKLF